MDSATAMALAVAVAVGGVAAIVLLRQRQNERRRRSAEMRQLDERVSRRIDRLIAERAGAQPGADESLPPDEALPAVELPAQSPSVEAQVEPVALVSQPIAVEGAEALAAEEAAPAPAPAPLEEPTMADAHGLPPSGKEAAEGRPRPRRGLSLLRDALVASSVVLLLVLVGSQLLPALIPSAGPNTTATPTQPVEVVAPTASPTAGATPTPSQTATPSPGVTPSPSVPSPSPTPLVYIVRIGDTLTKIASDFQVPLQALIAANPQLEDPNLIHVGDRIVIPQPSGGI